jgi:hypothetical protein
MHLVLGMIQSRLEGEGEGMRTLFGDGVLETSPFGLDVRFGTFSSEAAGGTSSRAVEKGRGTHRNSPRRFALTVMTGEIALSRSATVRRETRGGSRMLT